MFDYWKRAAKLWPCAIIAVSGMAAPAVAANVIVGKPLTSFEIGGCGEVVFDKICTQLFEFDDGGHYTFAGLDQYAVGDRLHVEGTVCMTCLLTACGTPYSAFMSFKVSECKNPPINPPTIPFEGCLTVAIDDQCGLVLQSESGGTFLGLGHVHESQVGLKFYGQGGIVADAMYLCPGKEPQGLPVLVQLTLSGCPGDLDVDGDVDGVDLASLLGQWGKCPVCIVEPCLCPADLTGDGRINGLDLAAQLAAWTG